MINQLKRYLANLPGWRTSRKIVVFESDDWGSIRMSSKEAFDHLIKEGISVNTNFFTKYDQLESADDLELLLETLTSVKDSRGRNAVFTTLNILSNPDFDKMREHQYREYYYEPFTVTQQKYGRSDAIIDLWKDGIANKLIHPEYHGREHLQVLRWMRAIQTKSKSTLLAEKYNITGIPPNIAGEKRKDYQAAFDLDTIDDIPFMNSVFRDGINLFRQHFGYAPQYFVPANGLLSSEMYPVVKESGIRWLYAARVEMEPLGSGVYKKHLRYLGMNTGNGLTIINRNATFEPSSPQQKDWVGKCLNDINAAFTMRKPAIISTHRVNYIGGLVEANRTNGLLQLRSLLQKIKAKWPDVEFMTTAELGELMAEG